MIPPLINTLSPALALLIWGGGGGGDKFPSPEKTLRKKAGKSAQVVSTKLDTYLKIKLYRLLMCFIEIGNCSTNWFLSPLNLLIC